MNWQYTALVMLPPDKHTTKVDFIKNGQGDCP